MNPAPNELSFLPDDYLENKAQRRANVICAVLFIVTMVSIGLAFTTSERSLADVEKQHTQVEQEFTDAARRIHQVQEMQEKQRLMAYQAELSASLLEKVPRSLILAKITNSLPSGVSLTDLTMESRKHSSAPATPQTAFEAKRTQQAAASGALPQIAQAATYDVTLKITGLAPTDREVADMMRKLRDISIFKDVNLIISDWQKDGGQKKGQEPEFRKFQIEMTIDSDANITAEQARPL